jgi:hypothetical protein
MTGKRETTVQDYENQTRGEADGPGLNRPAQGVGGQPPYAICETLTEKEIDMLLIAGNPLGRICLDMEIIDEAIEEQMREDERIENEIRASIEESIKAEERIEEEIRKAIEEAEVMWHASCC